MRPCTEWGVLGRCRQGWTQGLRWGRGQGDEGFLGEAVGGERIRGASQAGLRGRLCPPQPRPSPASTWTPARCEEWTDRASCPSRESAQHIGPQLPTWVQCPLPCPLPFSSPAPFPTSPAPSPSLPSPSALCPPTVPLPALSQATLLPTVGQRLPGVGGGVFALARRPCQKHLVYKLAAASASLCKALGAGLTGPTPGLARPPRAPAATCTAGCLPATAQEGRSPPADPGSSQPGLEPAKGDPTGRGLQQTLRFSSSGPSTQITQSGRSRVESQWGRPEPVHSLRSPRLPRPLAGLPLRQGKSSVTGPGRPGPGGRRATHIALLPTYGCCRPRALLGQCRLGS